MRTVVRKLGFLSCREKCKFSVKMHKKGRKRSKREFFYHQTYPQQKKEKLLVFELIHPFIHIIHRKKGESGT